MNALKQIEKVLLAEAEDCRKSQTVNGQYGNEFHVAQIILSSIAGKIGKILPQQSKAANARWSKLSKTERKEQLKKAHTARKSITKKTKLKRGNEK